MKKVFVCLDESPLSESACDYGIYLAKEFGYELTFIYITRNIDTYDNYYGLAVGGVVLCQPELLPHDNLDIDLKDKGNYLKDAQSIINKCIEKAKSKGIIANSILKEGFILDILLDYKKDVDLFITAIRGNDDEDVGFNTSILMKELGSPIMIINNEFRPISSIMIAIDDQPHSIEMLEFINSTPLFNKNFIKRHIVTVNTDKNKAEEILKNAKNILKNDEGAIFINLDGDNVAAELLNYRRANNLDIISVGSMNKGFFKRLVLGSVSENIVERALVPILLIPKDDD